MPFSLLLLSHKGYLHPLMEEEAQHFVRCISCNLECYHFLFWSIYLFTHHTGIHLRTVAWIFHKPFTEWWGDVSWRRRHNADCGQRNVGDHAMRGWQTQNINYEGSSAQFLLVRQPQSGLWLAEDLWSVWDHKELLLHTLQRLGQGRGQLRHNPRHKFKSEMAGWKNKAWICFWERNTILQRDIFPF